MPATSVKRRSLLAFIAPAIAPATVSALILYVLPFLSIPKGATTGMRPLAIVSSIIFVAIFIGLPTNP